MTFAPVTITFPSFHICLNDRKDTTDDFVTRGAGRNSFLLGLSLEATLVCRMFALCMTIKFLIWLPSVYKGTRSPARTSQSKSTLKCALLCKLVWCCVRKIIFPFTLMSRDPCDYTSDIFHQLLISFFEPWGIHSLLLFVLAFFILCNMVPEVIPLLPFPPTRHYLDSH